MSDLRPTPQQRPRNWVAALRSFARLPTTAAERCEQCGQLIAAAHAHLFEPTNRRFICACASCAQRSEDIATGIYRRISEEVRLLADFRISDGEWDALMIPIGLAFFFKSEESGRVTAMYPGPAGAVESLLDLNAWQSLVSANLELEALRPEVEALLVYRLNSARRYYVAPIDRCFALAGLMRQQWHGFSGGTAVWESIERFFAEMESLVSQPWPARHHG